MIVNSVMGYIGEIQHIQARVLRDKYIMDCFYLKSGPEDHVKWIDNVFKKFLKINKIEELFKDEGGYGQPRDVRESMDGEVILFPLQNGKKMHLLLCWSDAECFDNEQEMFEDYALNMYNICWNMGWIDEINDMIGMESDRIKYLKRKDSRSVSKSLRHQVFKRDKYRCLECGLSNNETILHIDHIIPVSQGGSKDISNLQTLCEKCNLSKGTETWKGGSD